MGWRHVVITKRCKLDLKMGYMVVRSDETLKIRLDELSLVIIENNAVSITGCLLEALSENKIKVIFCDSKRNPISELVSLNGSFDCSSKIKKQLAWTENIKAYIWTEIVSEKIKKQAEHLHDLKLYDEENMLNSYLEEMEFNDASNREGHSAKVYFNALFGKRFSRAQDNAVNAGLNYGYGIILSMFNREIVSNGYLTQLGLFHNNTFNYFNLSCDLMEPYRIIVDRIVKENNFNVFEKEEKYKILQILNMQININGTKQYLNNAVKIYCKSIFDALNANDVSLIRFYSL